MPRDERDEMDRMLEQHRKTWQGFVRLMLYTVIAAAVTLAAMFLFLA